MEKRPVGELRQRIVVGEIFRLLALVDVLKRKRHVSSQLENEPHLLFVEMARIGGIQRKYADGFSVQNERNGGEGRNPANRRFTPQGVARVPLHVLRKHRRKGPHCLPDEAEIRTALDDRQRYMTQVVTDLSCPADGDDAALLRIQQSEPRHSEATVL